MPNFFRNLQWIIFIRYLWDQDHELITTETSTPGTFAISGSGGYVDLYKALAELEKQLPRATWSSLAITQSNDFKKTLLHLVVSTPVEGKKP